MITVVKVIMGPNFVHLRLMFLGYQLTRNLSLEDHKKSDPRIDKLGRPKSSHLGLEICNNFNSKGSYFKYCHYLHVCNFCKAPNQGKLKCEAQKSKAATAPAKSAAEKRRQKPVESA